MSTHDAPGRRSNIDQRRIFQLFLIKPSHYDDDGYVIQWVRSNIPSNSLAVLNGIAKECIEDQALGGDVEIKITIVDEINSRVRPDRMARAIKESQGGVLVALVGVQSNQFPRAVDIARPLVEAGVPVCIGGFHISGCLAMLPDIPAEIQEALDLGISIFAGEAEGRLADLLRDADAGCLKPIYNFMADLPALKAAPYPVLPPEIVKLTANARTSFDAGRGCPFMCSFCTIINVQGRKSRYRSADDIEGILKDSHAQGIKKLFITDDNFARNRNWEPIFDRIIHLREHEGLHFKFIIQVDAMCHRIPNFVDKAGRAGVDRVFIGMESISPANLAAAKKKQNQITEYRAMLQDWKRIGAMTYCGYIIGFPNDTPASVRQDIEIIKRELPVDLVEFFCLTPLPGSEDHQVLAAKGVPMDPDMNNYDSEHITTAHPLMSASEMLETYRAAWHAFFTLEHIETVMRRAAASGINPRRIKNLALGFYGSQAIENVHPLQGGLLRLKYRTDRRPGFSIVNPLVFYPAYLWETASKLLRFFRLNRTYDRILNKVASDPAKLDYTDLALTPVEHADLDNLEIFSASNSARSQADHAREGRF
ncbi:MAG: radical SAM protein [Rhodobacteraceae bacterium]|nr:radical SAM protein [Paracoccaceae bacterium]